MDQPPAAQAPHQHDRKRKREDREMTDTEKDILDRELDLEEEVNAYYGGKIEFIKVDVNQIKKEQDTLPTPWLPHQPVSPSFTIYSQATVIVRAGDHTVIGTAVSTSKGIIEHESTTLNKSLENASSTAKCRAYERLIRLAKRNNDRKIERQQQALPLGPGQQQGQQQGHQYAPPPQQALLYRQAPPVSIPQADLQ
jgi:hypothetical protein